MKTGTIRAINPNGGYQSEHGYISTFMMTIDVAGEGQITGEIGSKSQVYPLGVNDQICVEITNTTNGVRFKKINPQYAQGGAQGGSQSYGQPTGQANTPKRDYDAENRGKCRTQFIKAILINSGMFKMDAESKIYVDGLVHYSMTGQLPQVPNPVNNNPEDDVPW